MKYFFVDVDGTLIDIEGNLRPYATSLLDTCRFPFLKGEDCRLIIWSSGGADYAAEQVKYEYASAFMQKDIDMYNLLTNDGQNGYIIDDDQQWLQILNGMKWWVPFYMVGDEEDTKLLTVLEDVTNIKMES